MADIKIDAYSGHRQPCNFLSKKVANVLLGQKLCYNPPLCSNLSTFNCDAKPDDYYSIYSERTCQSDCS